MPFGVGYYTTVIYNDTGKVSRQKLKKIRNAALSVSLRSKLHHAGGGTGINGSGVGYFTTAGYLPDMVDRTDRDRSCLPFFCENISDFGKKRAFFLKNCKKIIKKLQFLPFLGLTLQKESNIILLEFCVKCSFYAQIQQFYNRIMTQQDKR